MTHFERKKGWRVRHFSRLISPLPTCHSTLNPQLPTITAVPKLCHSCATSPRGVLCDRNTSGKNRNFPEMPKLRLSTLDFRPIRVPSALSTLNPQLSTISPLRAKRLARSAPGVKTVFTIKPTIPPTAGLCSRWVRRERRDVKKGDHV